MMFFRFALTFIVIPQLIWLTFVSPNLHLHLQEIYFVNLFDSFIPVIILKTLRFESSVLFGMHTSLDKSIRVLQLPTHLYYLAAKWNSWLYSLGRKLIRVGWMLYFWLLSKTQTLFHIMFFQVVINRGIERTCNREQAKP